MEIHAKLHGLTKLDFNRSPIRKAVRNAANAVRDDARSRVGGSGGGAGSYPGKRHGVLQKAIRVKVRRDGFSAIVQPEKTAAMGKDFYPAYLRYGTKRGIAPRANYIEDAAVSRRSSTESALKSALMDSIKPVK